MMNQKIMSALGWTSFGVAIALSITLLSQREC